MARLSMRVLVCSIVLAALTGTAFAADVTSTYVGSAAANWTTGNWTNLPAAGGYPDNGNGGVATYDAVVTTGVTLTLDQNITIQKLTLSSGTITGSFNLTTNDLLHATTTTLSGSGTSNINGGLQVDGYTTFFDGRMFNVAGSSSFTGSTPNAGGYLFISNGAVLNNSGTFDSGWTGTFNNNIAASGPAGTFNNTGTFTRSVGSGTTTVSIPFNNSNIVSVQAGALSLTGGGTESGSFQVGLGAALNLSNAAMTLANSTSFSGAGVTTIANTASVTGATTAAAGSTLVLTGTLKGAGTLTSSGLLQITGGTMSEAGMTNANGTLQIDGYTNFVDGRTFNLNGLGTFTGYAANSGGYFYISNGATFNNAGTFDVGWSANFNNNINASGTAGTINNTGTFTRSVGSGTTTVTIPFNNSQIVTVQAGKLALNGGGTQTGSFQTSLGATLAIGGNTTFAAGTTLAGPGTTVLAGTVSVTGPAVTYSGGGLLQLTGTLNGAGTLTATAPVEMAGCILSESGVTNANASLAIDGYQDFVDTRTLNINGTASFTGDVPSQGGYFYISNGAAVNNAGTFDCGWAANLNNNINANGAAGTLNNTGIFTRSVGSGTTNVGVQFNNLNVVTVQAGTLSINGGGTQSGSFQVAMGAKLVFNGNNNTFATGTTFSGPGTTTLAGVATITAPLVTYSGGGVFQVTGTLKGSGTFTATAPVELAGGTMSGNGITNASGGLVIDGYQQLLDARTLNVSGSALFTGDAPSQGGYFYVYNGGTVNNSGTFDTGWAANFNNSIAQNGAAGMFNNTGTFTKSVGSGTTTVSVPFVNSNTVTVQAGTLVLSGGGTHSGSFQVGNGATLRFDGNGTVLAAGSSLSGPGTILMPGTTTVTGPAVTFSGGGNLLLTGTLTGTGTLSASAPIQWSGGLMSAAGVTTANGGLAINGYQNSLDTRTLNVGGSATFTGDVPSGAGFLYLSNGAAINSSGTFDVGWSANLNNTIVNSGSPGTLTNSGTFTRSVGTGTTSVQVPFANNGAVNVAAGKLEFTNKFSLGNNSSLTVSGGRLLFNVNAGTPSVGSGVTAMVSGGGVLELAGSVSVLGVATPAADRVDISNNSSAAAGLLISAGSHQVGAISGTGTTQVNAATSLTADSIIQGALVIGGMSGIPGRVTIDATDDNGMPLSAGVASTESPMIESSIGFSSQNPLPVFGESLPAISFPPSSNAATVPEASTASLAVTALLAGLVAWRMRERRAAASRSA